MKDLKDRGWLIIFVSVVGLAYGVAWGVGMLGFYWFLNY